ncbi:MAG: membrane protein insertion efficiency factor YidD [Flavobacteriales bacterium]
MVKLFCLIFLILFFLEGKSQNLIVDNQLLLNNKIEYVFSHYDELEGNDQKMNRIGYNPIKIVAKGLLYIYQNEISPQLVSHCQFELTCSNFSKKSIEKYGFIKGIFLTADRLLKDNEYSISELPSHKISNHGKAYDDLDDYKIK